MTQTTARGGAYDRLAETAIAGETLTREDALSVLTAPDADLLAVLHAAYRVRRERRGETVHVHLLSNVKSGLCPEDCHYCAQSRISTAGIQTYRLWDDEKFIEEAQRAKQLDARRYCMALSGRGPSNTEINKLCRVIPRIKNEVGIDTCLSIGLLKADQAERLKEAGLDRLNHNLNTSERHHPNICTTHTYADRVATLGNAQSAGLELCSGGIVGQGEDPEDVADMLFHLRELDPDSVPLNFLIPIAGTPFENLETGLTPRYCLKVLALARFLCPTADVRVAGGREVNLRSLQPMALYPANSVFVEGYLTTDGQLASETESMIQDLGFELEVTREEPAGEPEPA
jgi:biotin synthase